MIVSKFYFFNAHRADFFCQTQKIHKHSFLLLYNVTEQFSLAEYKAMTPSRLAAYIYNYSGISAMDVVEVEGLHALLLTLDTQCYTTKRGVPADFL